MGGGGGLDFETDLGGDEVVEWGGRVLTSNSLFLFLRFRAPGLCEVLFFLC